MSLLKIMQNEREALNDLKDMLVEQYQYIMKNDVFGLEGIVSKIQNSNKNNYPSCRNDCGCSRNDVLFT